MWRLAMGLGRMLLVLPLAMACGGRVEDGSPEPDEGKPQSTPRASEPEPPSDNPGATELGACSLGPLESHATDQDCAWLANERCYQTREMACNCVCPRSRNSQCTSGFDDGPDGHVWVACN